MKFSYALLYVEDVEATMQHYARAFGLEKRFLHESKQYGEMNSGPTKLGFVHHETAASHGFSYRKMTSHDNPCGFEIGFTTDDVNKAYDTAIQNGATALMPPEQKPWGQTVSYVKDCNGFIVEICSPMDT